MGKTGRDGAPSPCEPGGLRHQAGGASWRAPHLGPGGEDFTWPDQVAPRGQKASSTRKIKPQTSNLKNNRQQHRTPASARGAREHHTESNDAGTPAQHRTRGATKQEAPRNTAQGSQTRAGWFVEGSHRCTGVCCLGFKTLSMVFLILLPRTME